MLNHQRVINALNDAISDIYLSSAFDKKEVPATDFMQQPIEKVSQFFSTKLNQLEKK